MTAGDGTQMRGARCAITGLAVPELLRASHIKPWAVCNTDAERLDVFNGLLLAAHLDAAFDSGFITVAYDGTVLVSSMLPPDARSVVGLDGVLTVRSLHHAHQRYLRSHRANIGILSNVLRMAQARH